LSEGKREREKKRGEKRRKTRRACRLSTKEGEGGIVGGIYMNPISEKKEKEGKKKGEGTWAVRGKRAWTAAV